MPRRLTASEALDSVLEHDASSDDGSEIEEDLSFPLPMEENDIDDDVLTGSPAYSTPLNFDASAMEVESSVTRDSHTQSAPPAADAAILLPRRGIHIIHAHSYHCYKYYINIMSIAF